MVVLWYNTQHMELKDIEQKIKEIIKIVELCPASLQEKCFEMLLNNFILNTTPAPKKPEGKAAIQENKENTEKNDAGGAEAPKPEESDIKLSDIHVKAKKFLEKGITIEQINNIYYKEREEYKPLFDNLKTSKISESQIRITLLEALKNGLKTGEFSADTKIVRELCEVYKCYDSANFAANFKKSANLFSDEYKKDVTLALSSAGKDKLAEIIKDLAA